MNYYREKRNAYLDIDDMIRKNKKIQVEELVFRISTRYGFGRKIVIDRLNNMEMLGAIEIKEGVVIKK